MKLKSILVIKPAEILGRRVLRRRRALSLALAMAHRVISAPAAAGTQRDQPAASKNARQMRHGNWCLPPLKRLALPAGSCHSWQPVSLVPLTPTRSGCSQARLFLQPAIMSSKWRLLMPEPGRRADARKRHWEPMWSSEEGSHGI